MICTFASCVRLSKSLAEQAIIIHGMMQNVMIFTAVFVRSVQLRRINLFVCHISFNHPKQLVSFYVRTSDASANKLDSNAVASNVSLVSTAV
jgi:hypothetical protein